MTVPLSLLTTTTPMAGGRLAQHMAVRLRTDFLTADGTRIGKGTLGMIVQVFEGACQVEFDGGHDIPETIAAAELEPAGG